FAALLEKASEHPLASSITEAARERKIAFTESLSSFKAIRGMGVTATKAQDSLALGSMALMKSLEVETEQLEHLSEPLLSDGQTVVFLAVNGAPAGMIGVSDPIKRTSLEAIKLLKNDGVSIVMLTGD